MEFLTKSPSQTKKRALALAKEILRNHFEKAFVLALSGDLGGGKTTFIQGLAKGLGIREKVLSPTFVIMKRFSIDKGQFRNFYHIDCYRIKYPKEMLDLGFEEIISDPENIVAIEWAERIRNLLPKNALKMEFEFKGKTKRKIKWQKIKKG
jgi:tRNA threonylcarbamoyladenosine biosynthesis protein TsaE